MNDACRILPGLPPEQQAIRARCFHPSGTFVPFERSEIEQSIPDRFERILERHPDRLAVKTKLHALTYDQLNLAANRVAHAVLANTGDRGVPVALLLDKDAPLIAAILGVLKAGRGYVPLLDRSFPKARITSMLKDSLADVVVTNGKHLSLAQEVAQGAARILNIDETDSTLSAENPGLAVSADALAYLMYTSGSTGEPKGVMHTHRTALHDCMSYTNNLHICAADRVALLASACVGASVHYFYGALLNGAALYPLELREEGLSNLASWLIRERITLYQSSANVFRYFLENLTGTEPFTDLRLVALGSAQITRKDLHAYKRVFPPSCILVHRLSTTEARTIRWHFVDRETQIHGEILPVGYAIEDKEIRLLDPSGAPSEPGEIGEIAVRSRYLSPGYWQKPDLTRAKFLPDPEGSDERVYLTGDLGRMVSNGCLEHLGRKDLQVKIRGFTVEVTEIERTLLAHPAIREAFIAVQEDPMGESRLVAYVASDQEPPPSVGELRKCLGERLPDYMVPHEFVLTKSLPLTPSGKIDRKALSIPSGGKRRLDTTFVAPSTPAEAELAAIWAQALSIDRVGVDDNFFDLGGHSLMATQIISRVVEAFQVELPLQSLLEAPTVAQMARIIAQHQARKAGDQDLARMLAELEALSEDEAQRLLSDKGAKQP